MDITHTKYFVQNYTTEKYWPGSSPVTEHDFGFWEDQNDSYDSYEEAREMLEFCISHTPTDLMRVVVRTTTVTTTENVLYRYTPEREAHEE